MEPLTTAELMALAVMKGDMTAARALAEHLIEDTIGVSGDKIKPIKKITHSIYDYRIIAYMKNDVIDAIAFKTTIDEWVREGGVLMCSGVDRIEVYNE